MKFTDQHNFHIPVMGLGFTIDSPIKVAQYGVSSVVSIMEDHLIEQMRAAICKKENMNYSHISINDSDHRAKRITAYLNLLHHIVQDQINKLKNEPFDGTSKIDKYFQLLPDQSEIKSLYQSLPFLASEERSKTEAILRACIKAGSIDVNIMTKLDRINYDDEGIELPPEFSDALSAFRGFANSELDSAVVFSAGLNPRLYSYCERFDDFFPDENGYLKKKIILKVSDYRSALIQGKFLAKKGLWVSEFRIESGINCGGHAFVSSGILLGPILEDFKNRREELMNEIYEECEKALRASDRIPFVTRPNLKISAQGGIGTSLENTVLLDYYQVDSTGWGSPFLLVPEVTNVETETLNKLAHANKEDYFLSKASPLGVPFHNFRLSSSESQRKNRIMKDRPGSPCYKKFLSSNTEFTEQPICTASRQYQNLKIKSLKASDLRAELLEKEIELVLQKDCLCEGLGASALLKNEARLSHNLKAVAICPGPNLAYFSGVFTFREMVDHIYGRLVLLNKAFRPNFFINELQLYFDYLQDEINNSLFDLTQKKKKNLESFKENLLNGIEYYEDLISRQVTIRELFDHRNVQMLLGLKNQLTRIFASSKTAII